MPREGPPTGKPIEVGIKGEDYAIMERIAALLPPENRGYYGYVTEQVG